jgi:LemA protein
MSFALIFLVVLVLIAVVFGGLLIGAFNKLVTYRNRYKNAFAQIEVQLKRRYDLIPNLVETAKGYMSHERETLEAVISARNQASVGLRQPQKTQGTQRPSRGWPAPRDC